MTCIVGIKHRGRVYLVEWPERGEDDLMAWLVGPVTVAMREARAANGYDEKTSSGTDGGPVAMLACEGRLFVVWSWYDITEHEEMAVGSGREYALGSLHTSAKHWTCPRKRITMALEAACAFDTGCGAPFFMESC